MKEETGPITHLLTVCGKHRIVRRNPDVLF